MFFINTHKDENGMPLILSEAWGNEQMKTVHNVTLLQSANQNAKYEGNFLRLSNEIFYQQFL